VRLEDGAPVFRAENLLEGARHDVFASLINGGRSYHGRIRGVRIRPSEPRLVVTMHETAPLRGRVVDARGSVSPGAKVSVQPAVQEYTAWSEEPWKPWVVRADAEGRFSLALPPVGVVSVVATSEEGTFESPPMQAASTAQDLTLVLAPPAEASGRVVTDAGRLVPEAMRVRVVTETGEELARVDTGDDDFFIARWPHSGPVRFVVEPCDRTMSIYDWTWEIPESNVCHVSRPISDPRSDLRLKLEPGVIRTGIVCDTDGTPLPEILISVRGRWSHRETGTDREGRWRIAGLCDAEVEVTATGADGQQAHARTAGDTDLRMVLPTR
jgi:hypothetical protein